MQQTTDFIDECTELASLLQALNAADWERETQFEHWTINQVLTHLYFWNQLADLSLTDPDAFAEKMQNEVLPSIGKVGFRATEDKAITERGTALLDTWQQQFQDMLPRWKSLDPKLRVKWAGPDMSVRSSMTARQMETWAHAQAIYDVLGLERQTHDRIDNIVRLGLNTFAWSYKVHQRPLPEQMPRLELRLPYGKMLVFGEVLITDSSANENSSTNSSATFSTNPNAVSRDNSSVENDVIRGEAVEFAQVVTQTRNIADTSLEVNGNVASEWMAIAQCFAGGKVVPPAQGVRFCAVTES